MVVEWLCPGLRPTGSRRPRLLHCKVILLDEHELLQDVLVSSDTQYFLPLAPLFDVTTALTDFSADSISRFYTCDLVRGEQKFRTPTRRPFLAIEIKNIKGGQTMWANSCRGHVFPRVHP